VSVVHVQVHAAEVTRSRRAFRSTGQHRTQGNGAENTYKYVTAKL